MKKLRKIFMVSLSLALLLSMGMASLSAAAVTATAQPTSSKVMVNGTQIPFQAYTIDGYNYFKLRDIAKAINGTSKQFEVGYDEKTNAILLTSGQPYSAVGGELALSDDQSSRQAAASSSLVYLDGTQITLHAYLIGGNNYFKLRDIGSAIDFGVTWDGANNMIAIDTSSSYVDESSDTAGDDTIEYGFFDPDTDYKKNPKYKITYIYDNTATGGISQSLDDSFLLWALQLNCAYMSISVQSGNEQFLKLIEDQAEQGRDGFLLDASASLYPRINELMTELDLPWMSCTYQPLDYQGVLIHPFITYNNTDMGIKMAQWVINYARKTWPNATESQIGMISMDFAASSEVHERTIGAQNVWKAYYPQYSSNFFVANSAAYKTTSEEGYNLTSSIFSGNPGIRYWMICACMDNYADGAARAAETYGIADQCVIIDVGGDALFSQWNSGIDSCWKAAVYGASALFTEPVICGLYAMMNGDATPETLWPEQINKNSGENYAVVDISTTYITIENYKEYLEYIKDYTGYNNYAHTEG